jgi:hypothetical protein
MAIDEAALDRFRDDLLAAIRGELSDMREQLVDETRASQARLEERLETRIDARIEASAAETRRHMSVVAEELTSKIALVAEGVIMLTERLSGDMREGFETLDRRVMRLEARLLSGERG